MIVELHKKFIRCPVNYRVSSYSMPVQFSCLCMHYIIYDPPVLKTSNSLRGYKHAPDFNVPAKRTIE